MSDPIDLLATALGAGLNLGLVTSLGAVVKAAIDATVKPLDPPDWALVALAGALSLFVAAAAQLMVADAVTWRTLGQVLRDGLLIWSVATASTATHNAARRSAAAARARAAADRAARTVPPPGGVQ